MFSPTHCYTALLVHTKTQLWREIFFFFFFLIENATYQRLIASSLTSILRQWAPGHRDEDNSWWYRFSHWRILQGCTVDCEKAQRSSTCHSLNWGGRTPRFVFLSSIKSLALRNRIYGMNGAQLRHFIHKTSSIASIVALFTKFCGPPCSILAVAAPNQSGTLTANLKKIFVKWEFSDRSCEKIGTYFRSGCSYSAFSKCCGILLQFRGSPTYQHIVTCAITAQRYVAWNVISPTQTPAASEVQKKLFSHSPLALIARQKSSIVGPPTSCQDWHRCQVRCRHSAIAGNIKWKPVHGSASIDHDHRWCSNKRSSSPQPGSGYAGDDQMDKGCCVTAKKAPLFWPYTTPLAGYIYSFSHTHDQGHLCWPGCLYDV